jgi:hypothetical protein
VQCCQAARMLVMYVVLDGSSSSVRTPKWCNVVYPSLLAQQSVTHPLSCLNSTAADMYKEADHVLCYWHSVVVGCVADVSEEHAASIFRVEVSGVRM